MNKIECVLKDILEHKYIKNKSSLCIIIDYNHLL